MLEIVRLFANWVARLYVTVLWRPQWILVTGSAGKTTTKALIHVILATTGRGTGNPGTLNGLAQVVRTVLRTRPWHRFCLLETATFHPGSIRHRTRMIRPDVAVVTTVGLDHYKSFRSREAVAEEKGELVKALKPARQALNTADPVLFCSPNSHTVEKMRRNGIEDRLRAFPDTATLKQCLSSEFRPGELVLMKGSSAADGLDGVALARAQDMRWPLPDRSIWLEVPEVAVRAQQRPGV